MNGAAGAGSRLAVIRLSWLMCVARRVDSRGARLSKVMGSSATGMYGVRSASVLPEALETILFERVSLTRNDS